MSKNVANRLSSTLTLNHEGEVAYTLSPEMELYTTVCSFLVSDRFYESADETLSRINSLIGKVDPEFVCKLAVYAREEMNLRTAPLVLCALLAKNGIGGSLLRRTVSRIIRRADEPAALLSIYASLNGGKVKPLAKAIQKGIADAFTKFDDYQLSKYRRGCGNITLRDALFLCHPKPKDRQQEETFKKLANNELEPPYTWEVELSELGKRNFPNARERRKAFKGKWEELVGSGRLGYMATLKNLRNMLEVGISMRHVRKVADILRDRRQAKKVLPYRFMMAYLMLDTEDLPKKKVEVIKEALEDAAEISAEGITWVGEGDRVLIACDASGSMECTVSGGSKVTLYDVGVMMGSVLRSRCKRVTLGLFACTWRVVRLPKGRIIESALKLRSLLGMVGYSTNGWLAIRWLNRRKKKVDKIAIFTDCQLWNSIPEEGHIQAEWMRYKEFVNPDARLYIFDLAGYGTAPVAVEWDKDVVMVSGLSDRVFEAVEAVEKAKDALAMVKEVKI